MFGAFANRLVGGGGGNPFPRPAFDFAYEDSGLVVSGVGGSVYEGWEESSTGSEDLTYSGPDMAVATWRNGKRAVTFTGSNRSANGTLTGAVTSRTWLFAIQIPPSAFGTTIGPCTTNNATGKNYPLAFKNTNVMTTQPSASNRDSSLDMSPYYGLDAIISVRQAAAGIRFVMRIEGVSGRVTTTAGGEATSVLQLGLAIGGWAGSGGDFPYPIAMVGCIDSALSEADQDEAVDWAAWEYDLITP